MHRCRSLRLTNSHCHSSRSRSEDQDARTAKRTCCSHTLAPRLSVDSWSRTRPRDDSRPMTPEGTVRGWAVREVEWAVVESLLCRFEFRQYEPLVFRVLARGSYTGRLSCSNWDSCRVPFQPSLEQSKGQPASRLLATTKHTQLDLYCLSESSKVRTRTKWSTTRNRGLVFSRAIAAGEGSTRVLKQPARKRNRCRHECATTWKGLPGLGSRTRTGSIARGAGSGRTWMTGRP